MSSGIAGIFDVATVPRFRRQGLASAITHAAMTLAREVGYGRACLQASAMGVSLYQRLGFRTARAWHSRALVRDGSDVRRRG